MEDVARPHFFSTVYGAAASSASSFVHHTQQISMAAVGGGRRRKHINKQARKTRTNWVTNKQTAHGFLRSRPPGEGAHAA